MELLERVQGDSAEVGGKGSNGTRNSPHGSEVSTPSLPMATGNSGAASFSGADSVGGPSSEEAFAQDVVVSDGLEPRSHMSSYMQRRRASREPQTVMHEGTGSSTAERLGDDDDTSDPGVPIQHRSYGKSEPRPSLFESLTDGVASLWHHRSSSPTSQDSLQSEVLVSREDAFAESMEDFEQGGAPHEEGEATRSSIFNTSAAELATSLKRLLGAQSSSNVEDEQRRPYDVSFAGTRDNDVESDEQSSPSSSSSSRPAANSTSSPPEGLDLEALMNEAHLPFRQLLQEVPDPEGPGGILQAFPQLQRLQSAAGGTQVGASSHGFASRDDTFGAEGTRNEDETASSASLPVGSPLFSAVVRARLSVHLLGCYDAVSVDLKAEEAKLWDLFVMLDTNLSGAMLVSMDTAGNIGKALADIAESIPVAEACIRALAERVDESGECDFADLLDVWTSERKPSNWAPLRNSFRNSLTSFLGGAPAPVPTASRVQELRARCGRLESMALANAAAAYQRTLVLTCSWRCEQRLVAFLSSKASRGRPVGGDVSLLLSVLRGIHAELVPTERVLWEMMGMQDQNFDGAVKKDEVSLALDELLSYHEEEASGATHGELEELERLRRQCQRRSVNNLFENRRSVAFADILRWWWDMPEEYREAAGLAVPASLLLDSFSRQPEEMFRAPLRRAAADPAFARQALRGHVRAFAELRALAVRRSVESFSVRSTAESRSSISDCGTFSCVTSEAQEQQRDEVDDEDAVDKASSSRSVHNEVCEEDPQEAEHYYIGDEGNPLAPREAWSKEPGTGSQKDGDR